MSCALELAFASQNMARPFSLPPDTPPAIIARLNREIRAIVDLPDVRKRFTDLGGTIVPGTPDEFGRHVASEIAKWKKLSQDAGIRID